MTLRSYIQQHSGSGGFLSLEKPISKTYEMAGILKRVEPRPVLFESVKESQFKVAGNLLCSKAAFAHYLGMQVKDIIPALSQAIDEHQPCQVVPEAPCQEVVEQHPDLDELPILRHCALDGKLH
jgi:UbiD family decarboxylase